MFSPRELFAVMMILRAVDATTSTLASLSPSPSASKQTPSVADPTSLLPTTSMTKAASVSPVSSSHKSKGTSTTGTGGGGGGGGTSSQSPTTISGAHSSLPDSKYEKITSIAGFQCHAIQNRSK